MNTVVLPWPPKELSPNARLHHMALHRVKKAYRTACWLQARKAGMSAATLLGAEEAEVHLVFYPPDKRNRDADNMLASMKAGLDGLADARAQLLELLVLGVDGETDAFRGFGGGAVEYAHLGQAHTVFARWQTSRAYSAVHRLSIPIRLCVSLATSSGSIDHLPSQSIFLVRTASLYQPISTQPAMFDVC